VPVLVHDDRVVVDSTAILRYLEGLRPEPRLFPVDRARRAELDVFLEWFNQVWKGPPNEIERELLRPRPDAARIEALGGQMREWLGLFEGLLDGRDYLFGEFSAAECAAFPFLKYALLFEEGDDELFHKVLRDEQPIAGHPRLEAWIRRVDERPRA
jgi:glutathione S-transferase